MRALSVKCIFNIKKIDCEMYIFNKKKKLQEK
jgi:hypothetical protein